MTELRWQSSNVKPGALQIVVWIREGLDTTIRAQESVNQGKENSLFRGKFYLCCEALSFALIGNHCKHLMMLIA